MARARLEIVLAVLFVGLAVTTALWPSWIEMATGLEPDSGSGELEVWVTVAFGALALTAALVARRDYRKTRAARVAAAGA